MLKMEDCSMKKYVLIASAICMAMMVSCNKDILVEVNPEGGLNAQTVPFSFSASREMTKSFLDGNEFQWEEGDAVSVCYGTTNAKFTYDPVMAKFTGEIDPTASGPFLIVYPYNADAAANGDLIDTVFPAEQHPGAHNADPAALLAGGQADDIAALEAGVTLANEFSLVRLTFTDSDVVSVSVEGNANGEALAAPLAGPVSINPANASVTCESRNTTVTLKNSDGSALAPGTYDIAVLPQTLAQGFKVVFRRSEEAQSYYRSSSAETTFVRNKGIEIASCTVASIKKRCWFILDAADLQAWNASTFAATDLTYLGADIDMTDQKWAQRNDFTGVLDGQNHSIYNFVYTTNQYAGLIRTTSNTEYAEIRNLYFGTKDGLTWDGVSCLTHSSSANKYTWYYVGVVAKPQGSTKMDNVVNFAKVEVAAGSTGKTRIGGVCGNWASTGTMINCKNYGEIVNSASATGQKDENTTTIATSIVGGVVGQCDVAATFENCTNYGTVTNKNSYVKWVGGILGNSSFAVTIKGCTNYGTISNTKKAYTSWLGTGGISGYLKDPGAKILNCSSINATVSSVCHVSAGIAAQIDGGTIENCTVSGSNISTSTNFPAGILAYGPAGGTVKNCTVSGNTNISGAYEVGGIVARVTTGFNVDGCTISNSTVTGTKDDVGCIAGWIQTGSSISNCNAINTTISGANYVGGIAGLAEETTVSGSEVSGCTVTGTAEGIGGVMGYGKVTASTVENCTVTGSTISGSTKVSGIVGNSDIITITGCILDGGTKVIGSSTDIGGIAGWLNTGTIKDCTVKGGCSIESSSCNAGGIVGRAIANDGTSNIIDHCKVLNSTVSAAYDAAGIVGYAYPDENGPVDIYNCGVENIAVIAKSCDGGGNASSGDSMSGLIGGWMRCSDSASSFKIVNCYAIGSTIECKLDMAHPSVGAAVGYISLSAAGTAEITNFCTDLKATGIIVNGSPVPSTLPSVGAIAGMIPNKAITVKNCAYINDGVLTLCNNIGESVVLEDNDSFDEADFGDLAYAMMEGFVPGYEDYPLLGWSLNGAGLPYIE